MVAYLQVLDNPADAVSLTRIANRPRRGIGDTSLARLVTTQTGSATTLWEATAHPEEAGLARGRGPRCQELPGGDGER